MEIRRTENAVKVRKLRSFSNLRECTCPCDQGLFAPEYSLDVSYAGAKPSGRAREARRKYWRRENMSENLIWDRWSRGRVFLAADQVHTYIPSHLRGQMYVHGYIRTHAGNVRREGRGRRVSRWSIDENDFLTQCPVSVLRGIAAR